MILSFEFNLKIFQLNECNEIINIQRALMLKSKKLNEEFKFILFFLNA